MKDWGGSRGDAIGVVPIILRLEKPQEADKKRGFDVGIINVLFPEGGLRGRVWEIKGW